MHLQVQTDQNDEQQKIILIEYSPFKTYLGFEILQKQLI